MAVQLDPVDYFMELATIAATTHITQKELSDIVDLYLYLFDNGNNNFAYAFYTAYSTKRLRKRLIKMIEEKTHVST